MTLPLKRNETVNYFSDCDRLSHHLIASQLPLFSPFMSLEVRDSSLSLIYETKYQCASICLHRHVRHYKG